MRGEMVRYLGVQQMRRVDRQIYSLLITVTENGTLPTNYEVLACASEYSERHLRRIIRRLENEKAITTSRHGPNGLRVEIKTHEQLPQLP